ncbi:hypothetical protein A3H53_01645 [Candidatus Nomurabacteria bacterium RIFCSPLOWO2_02_FULL_40_10]|uniref:DUF2157 domain-containing protein n=1 Tax=Candidatus Nomurabacteria bacterium RIFCSPLOWO2_02_FULL_40_10 TaxID=1801786 RepID=A0A1F6Y111_9BACT|nr:MAG: hypothetical protein A3H53_01645 [Candidatus Nomurabacteria bacterium RIFCSPLOWO2_02_FULL_40_10]
MTKEELFQELERGIANGEINREELVSRFNFAPMAPGYGEEKPNDSMSFSMNKMLYVLGSAVVVIGIIIFFYQIWDQLGSFGRISVTLGLGFLLAAIGSFLLKQKSNDNIGAIFHSIGGLLVPGGAMVTLHEMNISADSLWPTTITFGFIFAFYLLVNLIHKNAVLTFFAIANGTAFIYLLVESMTDGAYYTHGDLYAYLTMVIGISYLFLAHAFRGGWNRTLVGVLCFFGSAYFLGAAFSRVFDSDLWRMGYFLLVVGGLFLSAYLRSRAILVVSTFFLLAHVSYITGEYFADSMGWPISLVILGFIFIGLGYISININKKYIRS